jgi:tetratricopeptide (TPR) repeat protein
MSGQPLGRRQLLAGGCACLACGVLGAGQAAGVPGTDLPPGYRPQDADERGLWMQVDAYEKELARSNLVVRDEALSAYLKDILCRLGGPHCADVRIYVVRVPYANASMAPTGLMEVWTGMFLRTRSEAQLAAVLGHELGHYARRHSLALWRNVRGKTDLLSFLGLGLGAAGAYQAGAVAQLATIASIYGFSRDAEREADSFGLAAMARAGYAPAEASRVWQQFIEERDATARGRGRSRRDPEGMIFSTHPPTTERMDSLRAAAAAMPAGESFRDRYLSALSPHWMRLLDDQIKLNDFGGSLYLINALGEGGWRPEFLHARGELQRQRGRPGDLESAAADYAAALAMPGAPAQAHRGLGYVLLKLGRPEEARAHFRAYLAAAPLATDGALIAQMAQ